jgi:hypothetical protein
VTFEKDNPLRRLPLMLHFGRSRQRYYRRREVEYLLLSNGFQVIDSGPVLKIPVTLYRRCPARLLKILRILERLWPWPSPDYVLGEASQSKIGSVKCSA